MIIKIELPPEMESALKDRAAAVGQGVDEFVRRVIVQQLEEEEAPQPDTDIAHFSERLRAWIALHPVLDHPVDDSRESIYEGRE